MKFSFIMLEFSVTMNPSKAIFKSNFKNIHKMNILRWLYVNIYSKFFLWYKIWKLVSKLQIHNLKYILPSRAPWRWPQCFVQAVRQNTVNAVLQRVYLTFFEILSSCSTFFNFRTATPELGFTAPLPPVLLPDFTPKWKFSYLSKIF